MINDKTTNIMAGIVCLFVPLVYIIGVFNWRNAEMSDHKEVVAQGKHIYFVCFSSALYAASAMGVLLAKPLWLWIFAISMNSFCLVILYEESRYRDAQWTVWSWLLIPVVAANCIGYYILVRKYRKKVGYGR